MDPMGRSCRVVVSRHQSCRVVFPRVPSCCAASTTPPSPTFPNLAFYRTRRLISSSRTRHQFVLRFAQFSYLSISFDHDSSARICVRISVRVHSCLYRIFFEKPPNLCDRRPNETFDTTGPCRSTRSPTLLCDGARARAATRSRHDQNNRFLDRPSTTTLRHSVARRAAFGLVASFHPSRRNLRSITSGDADITLRLSNQSD